MLQLMLSRVGTGSMQSQRGLLEGRTLLVPISEHWVFRHLNFSLDIAPISSDQPGAV